LPSGELKPWGKLQTLRRSPIWGPVFGLAQDKMLEEGSWTRILPLLKKKKVSNDEDLFKRYTLQVTELYSIWIVPNGILAPKSRKEPSPVLALCCNRTSGFPTYGYVNWYSMYQKCFIF